MVKVNKIDLLGEGFVRVTQSSVYMHEDGRMAVVSKHVDSSGIFTSKMCEQIRTVVYSKEVE